MQNMDDVLGKTDEKYLASNGFDAWNECKVNKKNVKSERGDVQCCGDYPRFHKILFSYNFFLEKSKVIF